MKRSNAHQHSSTGHDQGYNYHNFWRAYLACLKYYTCGRDQQTCITAFSYSFNQLEILMFQEPQLVRSFNDTQSTADRFGIPTKSILGGMYISCKKIVVAESQTMRNFVDQFVVLNCMFLSILLFLNFLFKFVLFFSSSSVHHV